MVRVVDFGLAAFADRELGFAPGAMGRFHYMAPETMQGRSTPASDVYGLGLVMYELFTGDGPHLSARWSTGEGEHREENYRLKTALRFAPPSQVQNEIRNDHRWLDALVLRCLEVDPARRFSDAGKLLSAIEACEAGEPLPEPELSAGGNDVHRPAEWAVVDLTGARTLRVLGQAYLGSGNLVQARDCLEQLRDTQRQQALLSRPDYAAALTDLFKCYRALGLTDLARACQEEAKGLL
jgi:serine/threonine protein kinase